LPCEHANSLSQALAEIGRVFPNLTSLAIEGADSLSDAGVAALAAACPRLRVLRLVGCHLTGAAIGELARHCPGLECLDLDSSLPSWDDGPAGGDEESGSSDADPPGAGQVDAERDDWYCPELTPAGSEQGGDPTAQAMAPAERRRFSSNGDINAAMGGRALAPLGALIAGGLPNLHELNTVGAEQDDCTAEVQRALLAFRAPLSEAARASSVGTVPVHLGRRGDPTLGQARVETLGIAGQLARAACARSLTTLYLDVSVVRHGITAALGELAEAARALTALRVLYVRASCALPELVAALAGGLRNLNVLVIDGGAHADAPLHDTADDSSAEEAAATVNAGVLGSSAPGAAVGTRQIAAEANVGWPHLYRLEVHSALKPRLAAALFGRPHNEQRMSAGGTTIERGDEKGSSDSGGGVVAHYVGGAVAQASLRHLAFGRPHSAGLLAAVLTAVGVHLEVLEVLGGTCLCCPSQRHPSLQSCAFCAFCETHVCKHPTCDKSSPEVQLPPSPPFPPPPPSPHQATARTSTRSLAGARTCASSPPTSPHTFSSACPPARPVSCARRPPSHRARHHHLPALRGPQAVDPSHRPMVRTRGRPPRYPQATRRTIPQIGSHSHSSNSNTRHTNRFRWRDACRKAWKCWRCYA